MSLEQSLLRKSPTRLKCSGQDIHNVVICAITNSFNYFEMVMFMQICCFREVMYLSHNNKIVLEYFTKYNLKENSQLDCSTNWIYLLHFVLKR